MFVWAKKFFPEEKVKTNIGFGFGVDIHQMSRSSGQGHKMAFLIIQKNLLKKNIVGTQISRILKLGDSVYH